MCNNKGFGNKREFCSVIDDPDERDIYPYLDQPIPTVKAIYIVPDEHRGNLKALPEKVQEAFELGHAIFDGDL